MAPGNIPSLCVFLLSWFMFSASAAQQNITAESGQNVTLSCRAPNNNINIVEWSRADLGTQCVLMQRDGHPETDMQHPSFKNRVDLQDREMKDGDVSVILKNVTINDTGTYKCRIKTGAKRRSRALLKTAPISIITLRVAPPPGPTGGTTEDGGKEDGGKEDGGKEDGGKEDGGKEDGGKEDGGKEDGGKEDGGVSRGRYGLVAVGLFLLLVFAVFVIAVKQRKKNSSQHPADEPAVLTRV